MSRGELRQGMLVAVSTFYRLFGQMPTPAQLLEMLGSVYEPVVRDYVPGVMPAC